MHTASEDSDGLEEDYYVISRGDFSGSPRLEATGGERWVAVEDPPPFSPSASPSTQPKTAKGEGINHGETSSTPTKPKPARKMSVTQLVSKLDSETPKSLDKRLPTLSPAERTQYDWLSSQMHEMRRHQDEDIEREKAFRRRHPPKSPSSTADGLGFFEELSEPDRPVGLMPGGFFPFGEASPSNVFQSEMAASSSATPPQPSSSAAFPSSLEGRSAIKIFPEMGRGPLQFGRPDAAASERVRQFMERHTKANAQIEEMRRRKLQEQIARGEPVDFRPSLSMSSYSFDKDGNVINFKEGPWGSGGPGTNQTRLVLGGRGKDGSYQVLGELPVDPPTAPLPATLDDSTGPSKPMFGEEAVPHGLSRHGESSAKAQEQIKEITIQMKEEELRRGNATRGFSSITGYNTDENGNIASFTEGPGFGGRKFVVRGRNKDGSYKVVDEWKAELLDEQPAQEQEADAMPVDPDEVETSPKAEHPPPSN